MSGTTVRDTQIKKERTKTRENVAHSLLIKNIHKVELLGVSTVDIFCFIDHLLLITLMSYDIKLL